MKTLTKCQALCCALELLSDSAKISVSGADPPCSCALPATPLLSPVQGRGFRPFPTRRVLPRGSAGAQGQAYM